MNILKLNLIKIKKLIDDNVRNNVQRVIIGIDAEKPEDSRHAEETESHSSSREEHRQIVGEEGEQIDNPRKG